MKMCGKETAAHTECVFEEDHDPPCMDVRGKRHFVMHAEPPQLAGGLARFGLPPIPPGARFLVNVGGSNGVPILTLEEVTAEDTTHLVRDRVLATTIAAWAYATGKGRGDVPKGLADSISERESLKAELRSTRESLAEAELSERVKFADELLEACDVMEEQSRLAEAKEGKRATFSTDRPLVPFYVFTNALLLITEPIRKKLGLPLKFTKPVPK